MTDVNDDVDLSNAQNYMPTYNSNYYGNSSTSVVLASTSYVHDDIANKSYIDISNGAPYQIHSTNTPDNALIDNCRNLQNSDDLNSTLNDAINNEENSFSSNLSLADNDNLSKTELKHLLMEWQLERTFDELVGKWYYFLNTGLWSSIFHKNSLRLL